MRYLQPIPITWSEAEAHFATADPNQICQTLVRLAFHDSDWSRVEQWCLTFAVHAQPQVREVAAVCFGHLARIHGMLHVDQVIPTLIHLQQDPDSEVAGVAGDALADLHRFIPASRPPSTLE